MISSSNKIAAMTVAVVIAGAGGCKPDSSPAESPPTTERERTAASENATADESLSHGSLRQRELGRVSLDQPMTSRDIDEISTTLSHRQTLTIGNGDRYILDENGRTILLFARQTDAGFTEIYSPCSATEVLQEAALLSPSHRVPILKAFELPDPSSEMLLEATSRVSSIQADNARLEALGRLPSACTQESQLNLKQENIRGILQGEFAVTAASSKVPGIGTFGLGPCIGVVFYDRSAQVGAVAHLDGTTNVGSSLALMLRTIGSSPDAVETSLIGGDQSSRQTLLEIVAALDDLGLKISRTSLESSRPSEFVLDCRTGQIFGGTRPINCGEAVEQRMMLAGLRSSKQLQCEFDGRK